MFTLPGHTLRAPYAHPSLRRALPHLSTQDFAAPRGASERGSDRLAVRAHRPMDSIASPHAVLRGVAKRRGPHRPLATLAPTSALSMQLGDQCVVPYDRVFSLHRLLVRVPHAGRCDIVLRSTCLSPQSSEDVTCDVAGERVGGPVCWWAPHAFCELANLGLPVTLEGGQFVLRLSDVT